MWSYLEVEVAIVIMAILAAAAAGTLFKTEWGSFWIKPVLKLSVLPDFSKSTILLAELEEKAYTCL